MNVRELDQHDDQLAANKFTKAKQQHQNNTFKIARIDRAREENKPSLNWNCSVH